MRTRRQARSSEIVEAKEEPMPIEEPPHEVEAPIEAEEVATPLGVLSDDVTAFLKIEPAGDEPEERLQKILEILAEQQDRLKKECQTKLVAENGNAEMMKKKLMQKINELPEEFLEGPADDHTMAQIRMPSLHNMPSYAVGRSSSMQLRVVRVFNKDSDADQMLEEWSERYEELNQLLFKEKEATDEA